MIDPTDNERSGGMAVVCFCIIAWSILTFLLWLAILSFRGCAKHEQFEGGRTGSAPNGAASLKLGCDLVRDRTAFIPFTDRIVSSGDPSSQSSLAVRSVSLSRGRESRSTKTTPVRVVSAVVEELSANHNNCPAMLFAGAL